MRVLVCGDRNWTNRQYLYMILDKLAEEVRIDMVIEGEARGADRMARDWATKRHVSVRKFPALWTVYGTGAGPVRNLQMLEQGRPHLVVAFHNDIVNSVGTKDLKRQARAKMIPWQLYREDDPYMSVSELLPLIA